MDSCQDIPSKDRDDLFELGDTVEKTISTTDALEYFQRERRGAVVNGLIAAKLEALGLTMVPPIEDADYYGSVRIRRLDPTPPEGAAIHVPSADDLVESQTSLENPIGSVLSSLKLDAEELDSLTYGMKVADAVELMKSKGRTKMPLFFNDSDRSTLIGTVTMADFALGIPDSAALVTLAQTQVPVVSTNEKLSDWIPSILQHGFIYGRNPEGNIVQIYTTHDLAEHLNSIAQMFLRVHEIEELLRSVLSQVPDEKLREATRSIRSLGEIRAFNTEDSLFTTEEIQGQGDTERYVEKLMFSDYMKCISHPEVWADYFEGAKTSTLLKLDRDLCLRSLNDARLARNSVMHISRQEVLETLAPSLECLAVWLRKIRPQPASPTATSDANV